MYEWSLFCFVCLFETCSGTVGDITHKLQLTSDAAQGWVTKENELRNDMPHLAPGRSQHCVFEGRASTKTQRRTRGARGNRTPHQQGTGTRAIPYGSAPEPGMQVETSPPPRCPTDNLVPGRKRYRNLVRVGVDYLIRQPPMFRWW